MGGRLLQDKTTQHWTTLDRSQIVMLGGQKKKKIFIIKKIFSKFKFNAFPKLILRKLTSHKNELQKFHTFFKNKQLLTVYKYTLV